MESANEQKQVFCVGPEAFLVRDLVDAAWFRGDFEPVWREFLRRRACELAAAESERELDEDAVSAEAQTFRYDHDLITAEETENWLAERGLTLGDFSDYFARAYWGATGGGSPNVEEVPFFAAPPEVQGEFYSHLIFSGELGRMATRLSRRLAAVAAGQAKPTAEEIEREERAFIERTKAGSASEWCTTRGRDEAWTKKMSFYEATFRHVCDSVLSPQARQREVGSLRLQLTMFDLEILEVDTPDAAREVALCVREDGMAMEEIAEEGRYPFWREERVLEDFAPEVQQQYLSVAPGKVLEPSLNGGPYRVCRIMGRREPDPDDPAMQRRIEQRLLDRHFADAVLQHVRWSLSL